MPSPIVVIPEIAAGRLKPVAFELAACARRLQAMVGGEVTAVVPAEDPEGPAAAMAAAPFGCPVTAVKVPGLTAGSGDAARRVLAGVLAKLTPRFILVAHTSQGLDFGPALAGELEAGCITAVESLGFENGAPVFVRPVYGGKFCAHLAATAATTLLTVQPGAFRPEDAPVGGPFPVETISVACPAARARTTAVIPAPAAGGGIAEAEVLVAGGHGLGGREHIELLFRLAALFPKSAVAGSRIACDLGWLEYRRQVGVTGATVAPKLYLACGISGATQHVMGMRGSGFVVAVNKDPSAAIFREADVCIVEDLSEFIPVLIEAAQGARLKAPGG